MTDQTMMQAALAYVAQGHRVFPVKPDKTPLTAHGLKDATQTILGVKEYWTKWPDAGIAITTEGMVVVDFDKAHGGLESKAAMIAKFGGFPQTRVHRTGGGGEHWLYAGTARNTVSLGGYTGVDLRGNGGYIVAPPSVHANGIRYEVTDEAPIAPAPAWLLELARARPERTTPTPGGNGHNPIAEGQRNQTLASLAGTMRKRNMGQAAIEAALLTVNREQCNPPLPDDEVARIAGSIGRYAPADGMAEAGPTFHLTDLGNAERLAGQNQGKIRYCYGVGQWLVWNGQVWQWDEGPRIKAIAKQTARNVYHEAAKPGLTEDQAEKLAKHAHASESDARLSAMISLAQSEACIPVKLSELNVNPWLLNCQNGTIDLHTGKLLPHNADDLITLQVPVDYDPAAECPNWLSFLGLVTSHDTGLQAYLQKAVGYSLTGNTGAQVLFLLYGLGQNGKGTFTNTLRALLDGYACRLDAEDLMLADHHQKGGPKEGIADLQGARFAVGSEIQDGRQLNTSLIKDITGQDSVKARRLYAHEVEFTPQCKLWLYGNHKPVIKDTTLSIWRRMKLIPFGFTIGETERIDDYADRYLKPEWAGILAWAVRGCLLWQAEGLKDVDTIKTATARYRADEDILGDFMADSCIMEHGATIPKADMKVLYANWCETNKTDPVTQKTFKARLIEKGITEDRTPDHKTRVWKGIRARRDGELPDNPDKSCPDSCLPDKTGLDSPKLPLENATRKETLQEIQSDLSVLSGNDLSLQPDRAAALGMTVTDLPDCPACGKCEWTFSPNGREIRCPCGHTQEVG